MRIARLRMKNWKCFYGEQDLLLDAKVYAVVAKLLTDEQRSNFCGKSSLVEAIAFVLSGRHVFRTEDEFISRGERRCECQLTFDDGSVATRSRELGKRTSLAFKVDGRELTGSEAQEEIFRRIGLDEQDFVSTCCFEQRQTARFILARPEERMAMVAGWVGLAPLEAAEALARSKVAELIEELDKIVAGFNTAKGIETEAIGEFEKIEALDAKCVSLAATLATAIRARDAASLATENARATIRYFEDADRYATVEAEGFKLVAEEKALRAKLAEMDADSVVETHRQTIAAVSEASAEVRRRRTVAKGQFDGQCPIADIECPARAQINQSRSVAQKALASAEAKLGKASSAEQAAAGNATSVNTTNTELRVVETKLDAARKLAKTLMKSRKKVEGMERPDLSAFMAEEEAAQERVVEIERELSALRHRFSVVRKVRADFGKFVTLQTKADDKLIIAQEAMKIFGKNGAQRRVAEAALGQIEGTANEMLAVAGIDLTIEIRWAREGKGLASACEACGWAFPASTKVKECTRCREPRGNKLVHALNFTLSRRSGAAEDLVGVATQLAASAWLRAARGSTWETVILDEATAHLDVAHRRLFLTGVMRMLTRAAFTQAFIVAHSAATSDALPGRILIESDGTRATARVLA